MNLTKKQAGNTLLLACAAVVIALVGLPCVAGHLSGHPSGGLAQYVSNCAPTCVASDGGSDSMEISTFTYDSLLDAIFTQSSAVREAERDYELARLKNSNSVKLWDPEVSLSGVLDSFDVVNGRHSQSVALNLKNETPVLGGTAAISATSTYDPTEDEVNFRNELSVSFGRSLTTGGIDATLIDLKEALADLQADKAYTDRVNELVSQGVVGLSEVIRQRNGLIASAVRLELAAFGRTVAEEKLKHGAIPASSLAEAQESINSASKTYFDNLTAYRDRLWELSQSIGLPGISDSSIDSQLAHAREVSAEFLALPALDGQRAKTAAGELLTTLRSLVLLPDPTVRNVDALYEQRVEELVTDEDILGLPAMQIGNLNLEIQRLTLEKNERNLGWQLSASASGRLADFRQESGRYRDETDVRATVALTFQKQLLGSSRGELEMELDISRSRLEVDAAASLQDYQRQLANLRRAVEDKEYASEAASRSLQDSAKLWEFTVARYAAGMATGTDVLTAALSLLEAESDLRSAEIDCVYARLRLLTAIGQSL